MRKIYTILLVLGLSVTFLYAGKGKVRIAADKEGAYIYVDGKKKAMVGEGFTSILLEEGDHVIKVVKAIDDMYEYSGSKTIFVGEDTSTKLKISLSRKLTDSYLAKKDAPKFARWQKQGDVVIDKKLGLIWQDNTEAKTIEKSWKSAKRYCQNLTLNGYNDWRLPSYDELLTIVDYDRYDPAIMPSFKIVASNFYWSSSSYVSDGSEAWDVSFLKGNTYNSNKTNKDYVRCVRGSR